MSTAASVFAILIAAGLLCGGPVRADEDKITALEAGHGAFALSHDSLNVERRKLVGQADSLSAVIDSLKGADADSEDLHEALLASLVLVQRLVEIDRRMDSLTAQWAIWTENLRLAYDWQIGQLIQELSRQPDRAKFRKLRLYQEAREGLGTRIAPARMQYAGQMDISLDDGPDEIRQKMELMEDIAVRLKSESSEAAACIKQLEAEQRLRREVQFFTQEISLFDEHLPEVRILERGRPPEALFQADAGHAAPSVAQVSFADAAPELVQEEVVLNRQAVHGEHVVLENLGEDGLVLEIHKLKTRCQELRDLELVIQERVQTFHKHLEQLMEGRE